MWDENYHWVDRSIDALRKEKNRRAQGAARHRAERIHQMRQEALTKMLEQIQPTQAARISPHRAEWVAGFLQCLRKRLHRTGTLLKLFHFTLQFGRLRIELFPASGQNTPGAPHE